MRAKGQNQRLAGLGGRLLTLVAALAQLQGDDLPGHCRSDVSSSAAGRRESRPEERLAAGRAGHGQRAVCRCFDADAGSARVQCGPLRSRRAAEPILGIIFSDHRHSWNSAQAQSEATPPHVRMCACAARPLASRRHPLGCGGGEEGAVWWMHEV